jgi:hypothetical protein
MFLFLYFGLRRAFLVFSSSSSLNLVLLSFSRHYAPCAFFISYWCGLTKNYSSWYLTHTNNVNYIFPNKPKKCRLSIAGRTNVVVFWNCAQRSRVGCPQCCDRRVVLPILDCSTTHLAGSCEFRGGQFGRSCFILLARQVDNAAGIMHLVPFHPCH